MKEISFDIVSSWSDVTLEMFDQLTQITGDNPFERVPKLLSILSTLSEDEIKALPAHVLENGGIMEKLNFITKEPKPEMPSETVVINGKKYEMSLYPAKWTAGQYLDYSSVMGVETDKKLAKIIACFCVPEGHKYGDGYDFDEVTKSVYKNMSITQALGYSSFFLLQLTAFGKALVSYSEKKQKRLTRKQAKRKMRKTRRAGSTSSGTTLS